MNKIRSWYLGNYEAITWFLIGVLFMAGWQDLARGEYFSASVSFVLAALNYVFVKR
jgi:predicted negative regulator of RcsB-dependent stress response